HRRTVIIHPGSQYLRIGRATDLFPVSVPNVIARKERPTPHELNKHATAGARLTKSSVACTSSGAVFGYGTGEDGADKKKDPLTEKIEVLRGDLRSIMRTNKLRPVTNGRGLTASYNEGVRPERIPEHNDVYRGDWTDGENAPKGYYIGEAALQLPDFSVPASKEAQVQAQLASKWPEPYWRLFRPFKRALLNHDAYTEVYGPETALQALLTDIELIWTHALTAAPEDPNRPSDSGTVDYGLGLPRSEWRHCNVILIVPDLYSRNDIRVLLDLILGHMGFAAVCVQSEAVAATFGSGISSGCIVDIGLERIGISCVEEGLVLPETRISLDYGGADLTGFFETLLHRSNMPYKELNGAKRITDNILAESLKERLCTLNPADLGLNICDFLLSLPGQPTLKYMLRTYDEVILGPMALFTPRVIDFDAKSGWRPAEAAAGGGKVGGGAAAEDAEDFSVVLGVPELRDYDPVVTLAMQHSVRHLLPAPTPVTATAATTSANVNGTEANSTANLATSMGLLAPNLDVNSSYSAISSPAPGAGIATAAVSRSGTPGIPASSPIGERSFAAMQAAGPGALENERTVSANNNAASSAAAGVSQPSRDIPREASRMQLDIAVWASIVASGSSTGGQLTNAGINSVGGAAGEDRIKKMSSNIIVTGGTALTPGLGLALELRVNQHFGDWIVQINAAAQAAAYAQAQAALANGSLSAGASSAPASVLSTNLQARASVVPPQRDIDPRVLPWKGMSVFARLDGITDLWLDAEEWSMWGWKAAKDKVLFL
ncbi:actin-like protein arp8, partial [Tilletia horrida]